MAYEDISRHQSPLNNEVPADQFGEQLSSPDLAEDDEQLVPDETMETPRNAFRESLNPDSGSSYDDDFNRSLDPNENPHIGDQLEDENLQREAENDYR